MNTHRSHRARRAVRASVWAAGLAAALGLAACQDRPGDPTVGQRVDGAIAETKQATREAASEVKQAGAEAADAAKTGASDAAITTRINAALAADDKLSALKIDVDTSQGRVTLSGSAPDSASRERATVLARAVTGVTSVDNRLAVQGG